MNHSLLGKLTQRNSVSFPPKSRANELFHQTNVIFVFWFPSTETIKKSEGLPVADDTKPTLKKKKKKQPNPLSCKKKKKKKSSPNAPATSKKSNIDSIQEKTIEKKKRKRVKLPSHIKEMLQNK